MSNRERNINGNMAPEFSNVVLEKDGGDSWAEKYEEIKKYCMKSMRRIIPCLR